MAEEEGELEKRFKTVIEETILKDSRYDWGEFLAVIDEAKKEFPLILVEPIPNDYEEYKKWGIVTPNFDEIQKLAEWFVKWFGGESSEG